MVWATETADTYARLPHVTKRTQCLSPVHHEVNFWWSHCSYSCTDHRKHVQNMLGLARSAHGKRAALLIQIEQSIGVSATAFSALFSNNNCSKEARCSSIRKEVSGYDFLLLVGVDPHHI
jgi:hypothetical protein